MNIHKFYRDLDVIPESQRVLKELSKDYEIIVVTDPYTRMSFKSKHDWLLEHFPFIPARNHVYTGNKGVIQADYLIDDGVHNLEVFKGTPILFNAPYNRKENKFYRVNGWLDVERLFKSKCEEVNNFYSKE